MSKENKKFAKCDVCNTLIEIDKYGNGECQHCHWRQSEESFQHPNMAGIRNIPSLNNAIKQYNEGKSALLANFSDFINAYKNYGEVEFTYHNTRYGILYNDLKRSHILLNIETNEEQLYKSVEELEKRATINGIPLKILWKDVINTDFLQVT